MLKNIFLKFLSDFCSLFINSFRHTNTRVWENNSVNRQHTCSNYGRGVKTEKWKLVLPASWFVIIFINIPSPCRCAAFIHTNYDKSHTPHCRDPVLSITPHLKQSPQLWMRPLWNELPAPSGNDFNSHAKSHLLISFTKWSLGRDWV